MISYFYRYDNDLVWVWLLKLNLLFKIFDKTQLNLEGAHLIYFFNKAQVDSDIFHP